MPVVAHSLGATNMTLSTSTQVRFTDNMPIFIQSGGDSGVYLRGVDWCKHPFGPPENWPAALQAMTSLVLRSRQPMFLTWGPEYHLVYNDGFAEICGDRHPRAQGAKLFDAWYEVKDVFEPIIKRVYAGESIQIDDIRANQPQ